MNVGVLVSGSGTNLQALLDADIRPARIACVVSNRPGVRALERAAAARVPAVVVDHKLHAGREPFEAALLAALAEHRVEAVVCAGFMRILTPGFVARYQGRLLNIHPSLLPAFPGLHTHQRALDAGCRFAGATVHQVTAELDHGPILAQAVVPIVPGDTAQSLAARVLTQEHILYPRAIGELLQAGR